MVLAFIKAMADHWAFSYSITKESCFSHTHSVLRSAILTGGQAATHIICLRLSKKNAFFKVEAA